MIWEKAAKGPAKQTGAPPRPSSKANLKEKTTMKMGGTIAIVAAALAIGGGVGFGVSRADTNQPHMQAALVALQTAQHELTVAIQNKGGHRAKALDLVNQAITETEAGIAVGDGN
jgi:uncharacterized protein HemX